MKLIKQLSAVVLSFLLIVAPVYGADYGKTTQGASVRDVEIDVSSRLITVTGGEVGVAVFAYLQTTNGSAADCRVVFYNPADDTIAYQTSQITFTDDVGGWKTFPFTTTVVAGSYRLSIGCGSISGGANTVNIAYDTATISTDYRENSNILAGGQSTYPTFPSPITWGAADGVQDISIYFRTSSAPSTVVNPITGKGGAAASPITFLRRSANDDVFKDAINEALKDAA
jgi:hypothetical protein